MLVTIVSMDQHPITKAWSYQLNDSRGVLVNTSGGSGAEWIPESRLRNSAR